MRFSAIDVETANADMASICSIGIATFEDGAVTSEWYSLINPNDFFDPINISIHGISESDVNSAPTFRDVSPVIDGLLDGQVAVTHTHFDRVAMNQAASRWSVPSTNCVWLDSARVARRTWLQCARSGYGLANVCKMIGYSFQHHNALEDAKAAGHVLLAALRESGLDLEGIQKRVLQPVDTLSGGAAAINREGNPDGPFAGEIIVFTGALDMPRREAADLASSVGCTVTNSVSKKTTILVVGDMDVSRLAGKDKSSKHLKAEQLISAGHPLRIIRETDFKKLVSL